MRASSLLLHRCASFRRSLSSLADDPTEEGPSFDVSRLYRVPADVKRGAAFYEGKGEAETPLGKFLRDQIEVRGPMSVSNYMRECLCNSKYGYYTQSEDVFGQRGDFITAPEISQMFGECFGLWVIGVWQQMGEPREIELIEMGPGNGTLMADILRTVRNVSPRLHSALTGLRFVEVSRKLRERQRTAVCATGLIDESRVSWHQRIDEVVFGEDDGCLVAQDSDRSARSGGEKPGRGYEKPKRDAEAKEERRVQAGPPVILIGQEFLDALPIHQFEFGERGWSERLVSIDDQNQTPYFFNFVLSPSETVASRAFSAHIPKHAKIGDSIEFCPEALVAGEVIAQFIAHRQGVCTFVDYGHNHPSSNSLRAIRHHEFVHPLSTPGQVDLTADVNFRAVAQHVRSTGLPGFVKSPIDVFGAIDQRRFLQELGIDARFVALLKNANEKQAANLIASYKRLVDADQMGTLYKVLAIYNKPAFNNNVPVGFS